MATSHQGPSTLISKALTDLQKKNRAKSYSEWLNDNVLDSRIKASDSIRGASTAYALAKRDALSQGGIASSGYTDYVLNKEGSRLSSALSRAESTATAERIKASLGYKKYLEELDKSRTALMNTAFKSILSAGITSPEKAFKRAVAVGLSDSDARAVAIDVTSATRTDLFQKAVTKIVTQHYTEAEAREYATSLGLYKIDVDELARLAYTLNQHPRKDDTYSSDYSEYIENLKNTIK